MKILQPAAAVDVFAVCLAYSAAVVVVAGAVLALAWFWRWRP